MEFCCSRVILSKFLYKLSCKILRLFKIRFACLWLLLLFSYSRNLNLNQYYFLTFSIVLQTICIINFIKVLLKIVLSFSSSLHYFNIEIYPCTFIPICDTMFCFMGLFYFVTLNSFMIVSLSSLMKIYSLSYTCFFISFFKIIITFFYALSTTTPYTWTQSNIKKGGGQGFVIFDWSPVKYQYKLQCCGYHIETFTDVSQKNVGRFKKKTQLILVYLSNKM